VYFPPIDNRWSNDDYGNTVYKTSVFNDKDGTITGVPNSYIVNITGIDVDEACEVKPTWNAAVCTGDIGRMNVGGGGGALGFGGFGGGGGPPGAGGPPGGGGPPGAGAARAGAPGPGAAGTAAGAPRAPAAAPVFAIAPGGGRIRGTPAPSVPVVLSRNGQEFTANGETNVRAGTEYKVTTERPTLNINVKELDSGSWVMFELPGFTTANSGTPQDSLDALRNASATSYYQGNGSLWVKVVSTGDILGSGPGRGPGPGDSVQVSR
jgi:cell migration-inducing and hyaluronan-binding protein